ncbi:hypothetical protein EVAR_19652_1 [Eumeta japonica]|uniref:Uncharacterized protein n=1 Tax=Eumeta variegata TaxID=151549 RepID=A0A4C1V1Y3_EUMVA|nr:hypothetical protein EVAR_19652_1 [Eumeta japonica]
MRRQFTHAPGARAGDDRVKNRCGVITLCAPVEATTVMPTAVCGGNEEPVAILGRCKCNIVVALIRNPRGKTKHAPSAIEDNMQYGHCVFTLEPTTQRRGEGRTDSLSPSLAALGRLAALKASPLRRGTSRGGSPLTIRRVLATGAR